jgi:hypothetical protein
MNSKNQKQLELLGERSTPNVEPVTPELVRYVRRQRTLVGAWNLAQKISGLEDKKCYGPLDIDASHWTKIGNCKASPPADERFVRYLDLVGNEAPLIWLCEARGYDFLSMRRHQDDKDRRISELEQRVADYERLIRLQAELRGKG